jgi:hypothetical protein
MHRRPAGLIALTGFFAFGALIASVTAIALLLPGSSLEPMWHLNPQAHAAFLGMGVWALLLMVAVAGACASAAIGLWLRARWGHRLALVLLTVNLVGDATNAVIRGDLRTLIGLPIGGALLAYLLRAGVRSQFTTTKAAA